MRPLTGLLYVVLCEMCVFDIPALLPYGNVNVMLFSVLSLESGAMLQDEDGEFQDVLEGDSSDEGKANSLLHTHAHLGR